MTIKHIIGYVLCIKSFCSNSLRVIKSFQFQTSNVELTQLTSQSLLCLHFQKHATPTILKIMIKILLFLFILSHYANAMTSQVLVIGYESMFLKAL